MFKWGGFFKEECMAEKPLLLTMQGDLAVITLNRPKVHNALSIELSDMLVHAIQMIKRSTGGMTNMARAPNGQMV
jgi:1,4-dihydroxy-2-naphthoyl-CoA synthase